MSAQTTSTRARTATRASVGLSPATGRRRQRPWVVAGVLLVVGCALVFALASLRLGDRRPVLAVARAVPAGQVLADADLTEVRIAAGEGVRVVPASERRRVVGRPAAVPLVPGSLLTMTQVGPSSTLAAGEAVVGLALKAGQFPSGLAPGARVRVIDTGAPAAAVTTPVGDAGSAVARTATVVAVSSPGADGSATTVVSVKVNLAEADKVAVAAAGGRATLVLLPGAP